MSELPLPDLNKPVYQMFPERKKLVEQRKCPTCEAPIDFADYKDKLSRDEYSVNGTCQACQDAMFG